MTVSFILCAFHEIKRIYFTHCVLFGTLSPPHKHSADLFSQLKTIDILEAAKY